MRNYTVYCGILLAGLYVSHSIGMDPQSPRSLRSRRSKKTNVVIQHEDQLSFPTVFNQKNNFESIVKYRCAFVNRLFTQNGSRPKNYAILNKIQDVLRQELLHIDKHNLQANYQPEDLQTARHIVNLDKDCLACTQFINGNELYEAEKIIQKNPYLVQYYFIYPNYQPDRGTLVHYVLNKANKEPHFRTNSCVILQSLLKNGANPNATDQAGNTPMHFISSTKQVEILRRWGASSNCKNKKESTPLHKVSSFMPDGHLATYLEHTVDFKVPNLDEVFKKLLLYRASFIRELLVQHGTTVSLYNTLRKVQLILQNKLRTTDINTLEASYDSETLHLVCCVIDLEKDCQEWKQLIQKNELYDAENIIEKNPYLVQYYFTDSKYQPDMGTMIHYILNKTRQEDLFRNNSFLILNRLLKNGANPNAVNRKGNTPMHLVSSIKHAEILLRWGAYTNQKNKRSQTPLMKIYSEAPTNPLIAFLLYSGVNPNTQDAKGDTVFHHAMKSSDFAGCCTFLAYSASFMILNEEKKSPACYAYDHPEIKKLIEPYMRRFLWENLEKNNFKVVEECMQRYPWMSLEHDGKSLLEWVQKSRTKKQALFFKQMLEKFPRQL